MRGYYTYATRRSSLLEPLMRSTFRRRVAETEMTRATGAPPPNFNRRRTSPR